MDIRDLLGYVAISAQEALDRIITSGNPCFIEYEDGVDNWLPVTMSKTVGWWCEARRYRRQAWQYSNANTRCRSVDGKTDLFIDHDVVSGHGTPLQCSLEVAGGEGGSVYVPVGVVASMLAENLHEDEILDVIQVLTEAKRRRYGDGPSKTVDNNSKPTTKKVVKKVPGR